MLSLEAQNRTPKTQINYREGVERLREFLHFHGYSEDITTITKPILEEFVLEQVRNHTANSAITRYTAIRQFFKWCYQEDEIPINPMERVGPR